MRTEVFVLLAIAGLVGCAASGPAYHDSLAAVAQQDDAKAHLVIFRTKENSQYSARDVRVKTDTQEACRCEYGGFKRLDVEAGHRSVTVDMWDSPGICTVSLDLEAGQTYYFEVKPRSENLLAGGMGLVGLLPALAGQAIESSHNPCGGAFSITNVDQSEALARLEGVRESK